QVIKQVDGTQAAGWTINATAPSAPMTVSPGSVVTSASATADFALSLVDAAGSAEHPSELQSLTYPACRLLLDPPNASTQHAAVGPALVPLTPRPPPRSTLFPYTTLFRSQVIKQVDGTQAAGWTINATAPSAPMTVSPGSVVTSASATADFALSLVDAA